MFNTAINPQTVKKPFLLRLKAFQFLLLIYLSCIDICM
ncbi:hypothetical protein SC09_Contig19orf01324 [Bacillus subtilis]|uniref:Uncharacterized protein n=1 Tax=Bacillus subtilis TaxID=1423 RepID=A0A0D1LA79_BACIU|nr:hypothetical protein SC09_Contig19orf01324 [Bacillus subtilis]